MDRPSASRTFRPVAADVAMEVGWARSSVVAQNCRRRASASAAAGTAPALQRSPPPPPCRTAAASTRRGRPGTPPFCAQQSAAGTGALHSKCAQPNSPWRRWGSGGRRLRSVRGPKGPLSQAAGADSRAVGAKHWPARPSAWSAIYSCRTQEPFDDVPFSLPPESHRTVLSCRLMIHCRRPPSRPMNHVPSPTRRRPPTPPPPAPARRSLTAPPPIEAARGPAPAAGPAGRRKSSAMRGDPCVSAAFA